jgi:hypothetical protein
MTTLVIYASHYPPSDGITVVDFIKSVADPSITTLHVSDREHEEVDTRLGIIYFISYNPAHLYALAEMMQSPSCTIKTVAVTTLIIRYI